MLFNLCGGSTQKYWTYCYTKWVFDGRAASLLALKMALKWDRWLFLTLFKQKTSNNMPKMFKCTRPLEGGDPCGHEASTFQDLKNHRDTCMWTCPVDGCGHTAKKTRQINRHKSKHQAEDARRAAILSLLEGNSIPWSMIDILQFNGFYRLIFTATNWFHF